VNARPNPQNIIGGGSGQRPPPKPMGRALSAHKALAIWIRWMDTDVIVIMQNDKHLLETKLYGDS
jgi:hypothetical protein